MDKNQNQTQNQKTLFDTEPAPWELDAAEERVVVTVVLPEPPFGPYSYTVPETLRELIQPGRRVRVPVGRGNRTVVGYAVRIDNGIARTSGEPRHRLKDIA